MPLYFFHLAFGDRISPDEEGVELPSRAAASREAFAVARDLSDPAIGGHPRRWAGWFLQVMDERGTVLRTPIGYPALELVGKDAPPWRERKPADRPSRLGTGRGRSHARFVAHLNGALAAVARQALQQKCRAMHLLERNRQLRYELSCEFQIAKNAQLRTGQLVAGGRGLDLALESDAACRAEARPADRARPHLVLLPGGR
jgi:Domain of unknown function (DUF6894)